MVICPDCGKEVKDAKFCSNCGSLLPKVEEVEETADVPVENEQVEEVVQEAEVEAVDNAVEEAEPAEEEVAEAEEEAVEEVEEEAVDDVVEEAEPAEEEVAEAEEEVIDEPAEEDDTIEVVKKSKFCTNCGAEVLPEAAFCPKCGFKLKGEEKPQTKFCQNCGKEIDINAEICPHCGVRVATAPASEEKNVLLSAILSLLFPGLGHLYLGLNKKGISFIIANIVSWILVFILIGFVLALIGWVWALIDSIKSTEAINKGEFVEDKLF